MTPKPERLVSLDAYRGFVMLLILLEAMNLQEIPQHIPNSPFWKFIAFHSDHVWWSGCSLHDLIQPSFSFMVGVALTYSVASRKAKGDSFASMFRHAVVRSVVLVLLGVFLRSVGGKMTYWTFEDTLSQIGLGYIFLFLLSLKSFRFQLGAFAVILVGYWLAFALYPTPHPGFDYTIAGVPLDQVKPAQGFLAHWNMNTNLANGFDKWFLNLFPREKMFLYNDGGYQTLSFIPTLGTMILGLFAGGWLKDMGKSKETVRRLVIWGVGYIALGAALDLLGICPSVKRIWTPSWVLFSGGWCFLLLGAFYWVIDVQRRQKWAFPLVVIGTNSIFIYAAHELFNGLVSDSWKIHLGQRVFEVAGPTWSSVLQGSALVATWWVVLYWMYRNKIFIKV